MNANDLLAIIQKFFDAILKVLEALGLKLPGVGDGETTTATEATTATE